MKRSHGSGPCQTADFSITSEGSVTTELLNRRMQNRDQILGSIIQRHVRKMFFFSNNFKQWKRFFNATQTKELRSWQNL
jgi:hypothetical protein